MLNETTIRDLLAQATSGTEALKAIYEAKKADEKSALSLSRLCQKAGIPSKGYLSDVLNGRRRLNRVYWEATVAAFGLAGLTAKYLLTLLALDHATTDAERSAMTSELGAIRKSFTIKTVSDPGVLQNNPFAFEVFSAFGLFKGEPTRQDLVSYFGRDRYQEVDQALHALIKAGLAEKSDSGFALTTEHLVFQTEQGEEGLSHLIFLRDAIHQAAQSSARWYQDNAHAHFESSILSARASTYRKLLARLKSDLRKWQSDLEAADADTIVRFNVQIYPVALSGKSRES